MEQNTSKHRSPGFRTKLGVAKVVRAVLSGIIADFRQLNAFAIVAGDPKIGRLSQRLSQVLCICHFTKKPSILFALQGGPEEFAPGRLINAPPDLFASEVKTLSCRGDSSPICHHCDVGKPGNPGSAVGARKAWVSEMHFVFKKWKWQFLVETEMRDANTEDQEGRTGISF